MAKILFGGPQEKERGKPSNIHDDLIKRLSKEGHEVEYVTRGDEMMAILNAHTLKEVRGRVGLEIAVCDLIIYDSGLFFDRAEPDRRAELFEKKVIGYLKLARAPVIVLADKQIAGQIRKPVNQAGWSQYDPPYDANKVVTLINNVFK